MTYWQELCRMMRNQSLSQGENYPLFQGHIDSKKQKKLAVRRKGNHYPFKHAEESVRSKQYYSITTLTAKNFNAASETRLSVQTLKKQKKSKNEKSDKTKFSRNLGLRNPESGYFSFTQSFKTIQKPLTARVRGSIFDSSSKILEKSQVKMIN